MEEVENQNPDSKRNRLKWTEQVENILISWSDKAIVYKILHEKASQLNKQRNYGFTIPCVCLSTILASATFALSGDSQMIPREYMTYAQYGLGGVNIIIGILQTLQNFFKYAQMSEAHDSVSKQWYKLYRIIHTELNIARNKRRDADEFMKFCRMEYDRLIELSPDIPEKLIKNFKEGYLKKLDRQQRLEDIKDNVSIESLELPDICGKIEHTKAYRFDDHEEEDEKGDAFDDLIKKISNNMFATNLILNRNPTPGTPLSPVDNLSKTSFPNPIPSEYQNENNQEVKIDISSPKTNSAEEDNQD